MRVLVVGASGTIGGAVVEALEPRHEVVRASRTGKIAVDIGDPASVDRMFGEVGEVDAVVCAAAHARLVSLTDVSDEQFAEGLRDKLIGQATLLTRSLRHLRDGGSVTLTAGNFTRPSPGSAIGVLVNEGLQGFVRAAVPDLPRGIRANVVSPGWVRETLIALGGDPDGGVPARDVARAYVSCVEGTTTGQNIVP
ncbi:short chain dehydrogenase [Saccharothrix sp. ALI-22-I]|nr:short chain dehydrogenase [Saccharothrix sp. ALI-22-I]